MSNGGVREFAKGMMVSGGYFETLGVPAVPGRVISTGNGKHGCGASGPVAVISHRFWKGHDDGEASIIGRTITLDRVPFQIVGVTPAWFTGLVKE